MTVLDPEKINTKNSKGRRSPEFQAASLHDECHLRVFRFGSRWDKSVENMSTSQMETLFLGSFRAFKSCHIFLDRDFRVVEAGPDSSSRQTLGTHQYVDPTWYHLWRRTFLKMYRGQIYNLGFPWKSTTILKMVVPFG